MRANCSAPNSPALPPRPSTCSVTVSARSSSSSRLPQRLGVAQGELVLQVVEEHPHAQRLGQHRQLAADVAVADDAQRPPPDLVAAGRRLVPGAGVQRAVPVDQPPGQADDLRDRQSRRRCGCWSNGALNTATPACGRRAQVDLVGADAEGADRGQFRAARQHVRGHLRLRPDAQQVDAVQRGGQVGLVQRAAQRLHLVARPTDSSSTATGSMFSSSRALGMSGSISSRRRVAANPRSRCFPLSGGPVRAHFCGVQGAVKEGRGGADPSDDTAPDLELPLSG